MAMTINFINTARDNPYRRSETFGPYDHITVTPARIVVVAKGSEEPNTIAMRDSDAQWYCDLDGDLYTDAQIDPA